MATCLLSRKLFKLDEPDMQDTAGEAGTNSWDVLLWTPPMAVQKQDDQHEHTFSCYVRIRDVVLKTCLGRWTTGRSGERGSGISVLPARHDDDEYTTVFLSPFKMGHHRPETTKLNFFFQTHTHTHIYIHTHNCLWIDSAQYQCQRIYIQVNVA